MSPELAISDCPLDMMIIPDTPAVPASRVSTRISPDEASAEAPVTIMTRPPLPEPLAPAFMVRSIPASVSEVPTPSSIDPAPAPTESPVTNSMAPVEIVPDSATAPVLSDNSPAVASPGVVTRISPLVSWAEAPDVSTILPPVLSALACSPAVMVRSPAVAPLPAVMEIAPPCLSSECPVPMTMSPAPSRLAPVFTSTVPVDAASAVLIRTLPDEVAVPWPD